VASKVGSDFLSFAIKDSEILWTEQGKFSRISV